MDFNAFDAKAFACLKDKPTAPRTLTNFACLVAYNVLILIVHAKGLHPLRCAVVQKRGLFGTEALLPPISL